MTDVLTRTSQHVPPATGHRAPRPPVEIVAAEASGEDFSLWQRLRQPRAIFGLLLGLVAVIVIARQGVAFDWGTIGSRLRTVNPWLFGAAAAFFSVTYIVRGWRWGILLGNVDDDTGAAPRVPSLDRLTAILYRAAFVNSVSVGRVGDFYRGYMLRQETGYPVASSLGVTVTERLVDLAILALMVCVAVPFAFAGDLATTAWWIALIGLGLVGAATIALAVLYGARVRVAPYMPARFRASFSRMMEGIAGSVGRLPRVAAASLAAWLLEGVTVLLLASAAGAPITVSGAIVVGLVGALLTAIPLTPAGLGFAEAGTVVLLIGLGLDAGSATLITLLIRVINYWSIVVVGALLALRRGYV